MEIYIIIFILVFIIMINAILIKIGTFDEKTQYKNCDLYDQTNFLWLFLFFGVYTFPFLNKIKKLRKISYLKSRLKYLNDDTLFILIQEPSLRQEDINNEIFSIERYLKLEKLKRKV